MAGDDIDAAASLLERLLFDPGFRAEFRRDPASACRDAGLDELAEEMALGAGKAMHTLDLRESRSSLAGVMMAAALEGVGVFALIEHGVPGVVATPGAVRDVLSRVNLPTVDAVTDLRGALAATPESSAGGAGAEGTAAGREGADAPVTAAPAPAPGPVSASGIAAVERPAAPSAPAIEPQESGAPADTARDDAPAEPRASVAAVEPQPSAAPLDPAQFGAEGTGGPPSAEAQALLENKNVVFDNDGVADIKAGRIDPRVVAVLTKLSEDHEISVSCMCSDHSKFTTGGSISNHHYGRGMDIAAIDGVPVNGANPIAREIATELSSLDASYRPDEIGTPWNISGPGYFTDAGHSDHLHVAFKQAIDPSWKPPADQEIAGAPSGGTVPSGGGTLSIGAVRGDAEGADRSTLGFRSATPRQGGEPAAGRAGGEPSASRSGAGAVAENVAPRGGGGRAAGAKALAALAEATKYKGTPYLWGGSNPQTGFDCSGLVQWAYAKQGIEIPRVTDQQILASNGRTVGRGDLVPGDLVFFRDPSGYVYPVGISMGGDTFLHAPRTGDVVKVSSLDEPYFAERFTGGRRFDETPVGDREAAPEPTAVRKADAALARDAAEAGRPGSMIFKALNRQEAIHHSATVQFMRAVEPRDAAAVPRARAAADLDLPAVRGAALEYPGNGASKRELAAWLGAHAKKAGLPPELPVMAALVESGLSNLPGGDADSVGFFQMRVGIWNTGAYAGYPERPELQVKWFIDHAVAHKNQRIAAGDIGFGKDPAKWGTWIADVERPAAQYRYRYQLRLEEARGLLRRRR